MYMTANHVFIPIQTCAYEIKYNAIYNCSKMAIFMFKSDKKAPVLFTNPAKC